MYTKNLVAHRGTDNQILIEFVNQDQKAVNVTGKEFTCRLISHDGSTMLLEKPLVIVNATKGQTKLVLTEQELDSIAPGTVGFSVEQVSTGTPYEPVYVGDNAAARGRIDIIESIMPTFIESKFLTVADHSVNTNILAVFGEALYGSSMYSTPIVHTSSTLNTEDADLITLQILMDQYVGAVIIEGATDNDNLWYTVKVEDIPVAQNLYTTNVVGYHPYLRVSFIRFSGTVTEIQYR